MQEQSALTCFSIKRAATAEVGDYWASSGKKHQTSRSMYPEHSRSMYQVHTRPATRQLLCLCKTLTSSSWICMARMWQVADLCRRKKKAFCEQFSSIMILRSINTSDTMETLNPRRAEKLLSLYNHLWLRNFTQQTSSEFSARET